MIPIRWLLSFRRYFFFRTSLSYLILILASTDDITIWFLFSSMSFKITIISFIIDSLVCYYYCSVHFYFISRSRSHSLCFSLSLFLYFSPFLSFSLSLSLYFPLLSCPFDQVRYGAKYAGFIVHRKQWWRLVSPIAIHAGIIHLISNVVIQVFYTSCLQL